MLDKTVTKNKIFGFLQVQDTTVVLVRIRHIVGVELELVVVEVEDRRLREVTIRIQSFTTFRP